jgi:hypothetical protein
MTSARGVGSATENASLANSDGQFDGSEIPFSLDRVIVVLFRNQVTESIFVTRLTCEAMQCVMPKTLRY